MANPITFIFGYCKVSADLTDAADIFNICAKYGIVYRNQSSADKEISFECSLPAAKKLSRICCERGIKLTVTEHGIPRLFAKYKRRYGIYFGLLISLMLFFMSGRIIWDIRIEGDLERLTKGDVISELNNCGLKIGMPRRKLNTGEVETRVIVYSDDISWISINLFGTVAHVEIREAEPTPEDEILYDAANLVATRDGVIEGFEEVKGNIQVRIGDFVREGELLVSGIYDSKALGFIYKCSSGRVFARVKSNYEVSVSLKYDEKRYTGKEFVEKYLVFFDKEIKIYTNFGKKSPKCDIIDTVSYADPIGKGELPFGIRTVRYAEYEYVSADRSSEEAIDLAYKELRTKEAELGVSDVISKELSGSFETADGKEVYVLRCSAVSVMNIAKQVEIEVETLPKRE